MTHENFDVHVIAVGPVKDFPGADTAGEAKFTAATLARMGGGSVEPVEKLELIGSLSEADDALARWSTKRDGVSRSSVLLWFGHGQAREVGAVLHVPRIGPDVGNAFVTPVMLAHHIHDEQNRRRRADDELWAIVVIEACNGKTFAADIAHLFEGSKQPPGHALLLIGSGQASGPGYLGRFRQALDEYLDDLTHQDQVFTMRDIEANVCKDSAVFSAKVLGDAGAEFRLVRPDDLRGAGAMTVADQQLLKAGEVPVSAPAGEVVAGAGHLETTTRFAGRVRDLREIAKWAANSSGPPVFVVTGPPGAGKSALLAEVVRRGAPGDVTGFTVVLPLTGSTPGDVLERLATALNVSDRTAPVLEAVRTHLEGGPGGLIVADALDEARDPVQVASVLRELTDAPGVRLLIGTRATPSTAVGDTTGIGLLEVLGSRTEHTQVWQLTSDASAVREYTEESVRRLVRNSAEGEVWREQVVRIVADAVEAHVERGDWQFLHATLVVRELAGRGTLLSDGKALEQLLQRDRSGLFGAAVARITEGMPAAKAFLRALTHGHGRGLPRAEGIWERAASGVAGNRAAAVDGDLARFLHRAAAYVLLDGEDNRSVYRLANRSFAEQLLESGNAEQERFGILAALLDLADGQARRGERLSPHLRARLAEYAADCGSRGWAALAEYPAVLDRLPMPSLSALALSPRPEAGAAAVDLPIEVLGSINSAHLIELSGPDDRPGLRQLGGLRATGQVHPAGPDAAWRVGWGRLRRVPPHLQLEGVDGAVSAVASDASASWLATGSLDGTILVWQPWRRHRPSMLVRECAHAVTAIAARSPAAGPDRPSVLAAAHEDRTVQLWDLTQERPTPYTETAREVIKAMVALDHAPGCFAIAGEAGYVALLDSAGVRPHVTEPPSHADVVGIIAVRGHDGEQFVVTAQQSGHLGLWSVAGTAPSLRSFVVICGEPAGLAAATSDGRTTLVVTTADGAAEYWEVDAGDRLVPELSGRRDDRPQNLEHGAVPALIELSGRLVPVFGCPDGTLLLPCPGGRFELVPVGTRRVRAIGVLRGPHSGPVLAVIVERDARVHFWDPSVAIGHDGGDGTHLDFDAVWRQTLADAELPTHAIAAEGVPADFAEIARGEHSRMVSSVTLDHASGDSASRVIATAGREGTVVLWQPVSAGQWTRARVIRLGSPCLDLVALAGRRLAVRTDDGVLVLDLEKPQRLNETEHGDE